MEQSELKLLMMKNLMKCIPSTLFFGLFLSLTAVVQASEPMKASSIFDIMSHKAVLDLTLETNFTALKTDRKDESFHKAKISFKNVAGETEEWELKVKLRGAFRRIKCTDVPPLKLNFKKSALLEAGLSKHDDMKLVPQCIADDEMAREVLLKEYLTYKLYNEISNYSYRVQLVKITYVDTETGKKDKQWAFLIEDTAQLRSRIGAKKMDDQFNVPSDSFHLVQARTVALFQYMIGNADWGFERMKNIKFVKRKGKIIPIPYDFDFSGLVNAPYAIPNSNVGQLSLQDRIYLGFEKEASQLDGAIRHFYTQRKKLEKMVMDFKVLPFHARLEVVAYLDDFFDGSAPVRMREVAMMVLDPHDPHEQAGN